jgi:hypothetical protein
VALRRHRVEERVGLGIGRRIDRLGLDARSLLMLGGPDVKM